jgi:glycosyltransferase involved in cell wall biosynthesis
MYTPTRTDERNVSARRVFFGGISVYLEQHAAFFRHTPWMIDRLWDAPWLLRAAAGRAFTTAPEQLGALTVSVLEGREGHHAKEIDKLVDWLRRQPAPDVVDISNSLLLGLAGPLKEALQRPVCCTLQGEDVFLERLPPAHRDRALDLMRQHASGVDGFIAVSDYNARRMRGLLRVPAHRMRVVPLGIGLDGYEAGRARTDARVTFGYFGRIAPEKGLHLFCEAVRRLRERGGPDGLAVAIAGYVAPEHERYLSSILAQVREWGMERDVHYSGSPDRNGKIAFLQQIDLLVAPSAYDDPKGLALLEAMACGVPVVAPRRGTYTELVTSTGGGVLVPPDDVESLSAALAELAADPARRRALGAQGASHVHAWHSAAVMATRLVDVYAELTVTPRAGARARLDARNHVPHTRATTTRPIQRA